MASSTQEYIGNVFLMNTPSFEEPLSLPGPLPIRLSQYCSTLHDPTMNLADRHRLVQASTSVLASLSSLSLPTNTRKLSAAERARADVEGHSETRGTPQHGRENVKRIVSAARTVDTKILAQLGLNIPRSADDVIRIQEQLLCSLKGILTVC